MNRSRRRTPRITVEGLEARVALSGVDTVELANPVEIPVPEAAETTLMVVEEDATVEPDPALLTDVHADGDPEAIAYMTTTSVTPTATQTTDPLRASIARFLDGGLSDSTELIYTALGGRPKVTQSATPPKSQTATPETAPAPARPTPPAETPVKTPSTPPPAEPKVAHSDGDDHHHEPNVPVVVTTLPATGGEEANTTSVTSTPDAPVANPTPPGTGEPIPTTPPPDLDPQIYQTTVTPRTERPAPNERNAWNTSTGRPTPLTGLVRGGVVTVRDPATPNGATAYLLNGQSRVSPLGRGTISGALMRDGLVPPGGADLWGNLTLTNAQGSVVLRVSGSSQPARPGGPIQLETSIVTATGQYENLRGVGNITLRLSGDGFLASLALAPPRR
jgi:hypothetical protein